MPLEGSLDEMAALGAADPEAGTSHENRCSGEAAKRPI
jgi:hypothetical protein